MVRFYFAFNSCQRHNEYIINIKRDLNYVSYNEVAVGNSFPIYHFAHRSWGKGRQSPTTGTKTICNMGYNWCSVLKEIVIRIGIHLSGYNWGRHN